MISVVIPVYNVDKYITDCLESIVSQTFSEWEVVMVNDGSSDRSVEICKSFCERDSRFRVLEQENRGVSAARNTGIDACRGEYIFFMDADDTILPNTFEALNAVLHETKADMVSFQFQKIVDESEIHQVSQTGKIQVITAYEALRLFLQEQQIVKERIEGGANEKAVLRLFINCPFVCINFDFFWLNKARQLYMDF